MDVINNSGARPFARKRHSLGKIVLILFWLCSYDCMRSDKTIFNATQVAELKDITSLFCPDMPAVSCRSNSSDSNKDLSDSSNCCAVCSCDEACGMQGQCCYDEDDVYELEEKGIMKCMFPTTRGIPQTSDYPMYKFVVGPPSGGCHSAGSCNASADLIPWKTFYPVFSRSRKLNYISKECADCHGVTDPIYFRSALYSSGPIDIDKIMDDVLVTEFRRRQLAFLTFVHPGKGYEQLYGICGVKPFLRERCTTSKLGRMEIEASAQNVHNSWNDMEIACVNGPMAPVLYNLMMYKNTFCLYCNQVVNDYRQCLHAGADMKFFGKVLSTVIDFKYVRRVQAVPDSQADIEPTQLACKVGTVGDCRPFFCPAFQIQNSDGECVFYSKKTAFLGRSLCIRLKLTTSLNENVQHHFLRSNATHAHTFKRHSPWNARWELHKLGIRSYQSQEKHVLEVVVSQCVKQQVFDPSVFVRSITTSMSRTWLIQTDFGVFSMRQNLLGHILVQDKDKYKPISDTFGTNTTDAQYRLQSVHWVKLDTPWGMQKTLGLDNSNIVKLMFCPNIELNETEYELSTDHRVIAMKSPQRFLYQFEFNKDRDSMRVCLEDAGMEIVRNKAFTVFGFQKMVYNRLVACACIGVYIWSEGRIKLCADWLDFLR